MAEAGGETGGAASRDTGGVAAWRLAFRFARRELRGGLAGFRVFLLCLALGVGAIAAVGSLAAAVEQSVARDAQKLLGGDLVFRLIYRPITPEARAFLETQGRLSLTREMRAMAIHEEASVLVELKAIDPAYPLYGALRLKDGGDPAAALRSADGLPSALIDEALLARLDLTLGARLRIGEQIFAVRGVIEAEPDRGGQVFALGPRLMIADASLEMTGLVQPGSLIYHNYRLALAPGADAAALAAEAKRLFPQQGWRIIELDEAAPGLRNLIGRAALFMSLVGLGTLLIGGIGIGNAVAAYLEGRRQTIATLRCVGAPTGLIYRLYILLVTTLGAVGALIGVALGAAALPIAAPLLGEKLALDLGSGLAIGPLIGAFAFGLFVALLFAYWPLARIGQVTGAALFRDHLPGEGRGWKWRQIAGFLLLLGALAALAIGASNDRLFAAGFVVGAAIAFLLFHGLAKAAAGLARALASRARGRPILRLSLANLARPGAATASVVLSLGLGLTVLLTVELSRGSLARELVESIPTEAPSFYFIDIQDDQRQPFVDLVGTMPSLEKLETVPMLRGRIVAIKDVPTDLLTPPPDVEWVLRGDRGLTWSATLPAKSEIVAGSWWPADYVGPPLVSFEAEAAAGLGLAPGDKIRVNVLGREIEAEIANIRAFEWTDLTINFVMVFSPGSFAGAPATWLATARLAPEDEALLQRKVVETFPNISAIRIKETLVEVDRILTSVGQAVGAAAGLTLLVGLMVLMGAVHAERRRRAYDGVLLKVLGATRRDLAFSLFFEYLALGAIVALLALALGSAGAYAVVAFAMESDFLFAPWRALAILIGGIAAVTSVGLIGSWITLSGKAAPYLRNA